MTDSKEASQPSVLRHRGRWVFLVGLVLAGAWLGWCAHLALSARSQLRSAQIQLRKLGGADGLRPILQGDTVGLSDARRRLVSADEDLQSAWLSPLTTMPFVGRQVNSARSLTHTSRSVVDAVSLAAADFAPANRDKMSRVELVAALSKNSRRLADVIDQGDLGPSSGLIVALSDGRAELAKQLLSIRKPLDKANAVLPGLQRLIAGPTRLLVVAANNAQMAAGSGLPLAVTTADFADGKITVGQFEWTSNVTVPAGSIQLPSELEQLWGFATPSENLKHAFVTPRFDVTAPLIAKQYEAATKTKVDGVLLIDIVGLQKLVAASGPNSDPKALTADEIIPELMNGQYLSVDYGKKDSHADREERLSEVTRSVVSTLLDAKSRLSEVGKAIGQSIAGRHLLLWSKDVDLQNGLNRSEVDGALRADSIAVSLQNEASNKMDWFMRLSANLSTETGAAGERNVTVQVTVKNEVSEGQPRYVAGPTQPKQVYGDYVGYLTINVPRVAAHLRLGDTSPVIVGGYDGPTLTIGQLVIVHKGESSTVKFHFVMPKGTSSVQVEPSGRFPSLQWTKGSVTWADTERRRVELI